MKTHMGAFVCDNIFGTDVEELFLNIKAKLFYCVSVQFVFMKNIFSVLHRINLFAVFHPYLVLHVINHSKKKKKKTLYPLSCVQCFFLLMERKAIVRIYLFF